MATKKSALSIIGLFLIIALMSFATATISQISLSSPANASTTSDSTPDFTFTAISDINTTFPCELFVNNTGYGTNNSVANNTATTITANSSLSDGTYTWYINCTDANGTIASSSRILTINTTISVTINSPSANSWHNSDFTINATISGNPTSVNYRWENSTANGTWTAMSNTTATLWNATFNISSVADGNYTIRINATSASATNSSETVFVYVDDTNPTISSFAQTKTDTITVGESLSASDFSCSASDNSESFGGSVSTSITGFETGTKGSHTATCTATDSAGNTATDTVEYVVYGTSTSTSSGETTSEPTSTETISNISAGEVTKFTNLDGNTGIEEIRIQVNENVDSIQLSAKKLAEKPATTDEVPDEAYQYMQITATNLEENNLQAAIIKFKVEKTWIESNNIDKNFISLYRWSNDTWNKLVTNLVDEDEIYYYYEAETPGFSYFAISGKTLPSGAAAETTTSEENKTAVTTTTNVSEQITRTGIYITIILIVLILVIGYYFFFRKPTKETKPSKFAGKYVKIKVPKKK